VAICLGAPPAASLIAHARASYHLSKYSLIAAVHQGPFELATALTTDLDVPAYSEYVLEGYVIPQARYPEGPLGDLPGIYSPLRKQPRIKVTTVSHRTAPIMETSYLGRPWTEHDCMVGLTSSLSLYKEMRENVPQVVKFGGHAHSIGFRLAIPEAGSLARQNKAEVRTIDVVPQVEAYRTLIRRHQHAREGYGKQQLQSQEALI
jgi:UbiD family decarboxylase